MSLKLPGSEFADSGIAFVLLCPVMAHADVAAERGHRPLRIANAPKLTEGSAEAFIAASFAMNSTTMPARNTASPSGAQQSRLKACIDHPEVSLERRCDPAKRK